MYDKRVSPLVTALLPEESIIDASPCDESLPNLSVGHYNVDNF